MVEFEVLKSKEINFGSNDFIEVARKKAVSDDGETEFLALTRGYYDRNDDKRYKTNFSIPKNKEVIDFIMDNLPEMIEDGDLEEDE
ncbi:MAG: hypothetical protein SVV03_03730 [Candidatus Nanohaloarchaea archaeon]|nr:hypothetical protein [Candidatus Nanohaloarchaea archaeon]